MGIKSTITLTRSEAERRYIELHNRFLVRVEDMTDEFLENEIARLNDIACGGECFENYIIKENHDENI